ncbi:MAG TPA: helicase HerA-like domain-containing protein [Pirellulales bacterium]|nr:helicase HerA-like domain-containing protein [Pirellulales bacterium]
MSSTDSPPQLGLDPRIAAFRSPSAREVFHSVCHAKEIGTPDPFDVRSIHAEVRDAFEAMIARATTPPGTPSGRSLLLLGESGSGKTHLMRAFRNYVHSRDLGYCGYLQMTTPTQNYGRYILAKLLASLDERYDDPRVQQSGLMCLSTAVVESLGSDYTGIIDELRTAHFRPDEFAELVDRLAKDILEGLDPHGHDLLGPLRALVYLQRQDSAVRAAAHSYLRCEDLSRFDRETLGGIVPRTDDSHPLDTIASLGYLMWVIHGRPLVLFVDQLEEMYNLENAKELFRRAMGALNTVAENVPSSTVVIACLEDYYQQLKRSLAQSLIDRIERNPDTMRLESQRSEQEIIDLVSARLAVLYEDAGLEPDGDDPTFPIPIAQLRERRNLRTRDVLDWCRRFQEQDRLRSDTPDHSPSSVAGTEAGRRGHDTPQEALSASDAPAISAPGHRRDGVFHEGTPIQRGSSPATAVPDVADVPDRGVAELEERWQTFQAEGKWTVPADEAELADVLARALEHCNRELPPGRLAHAAADGRYVDLKLTEEAAQPVEVLVAVCNKGPQGGGLAKQVEELVERAAGRGRFMVRSMEFPSNPKAHISTVLGNFITHGGRRAVIEDSQWRAMLAFHDFRQAHQGHTSFARWLTVEKPLARLRPLREMLDASGLEKSAPPPAPPAGQGRAGESPTPSPKPVPAVAATPQICPALALGKSAGLSAAPVEMTCDELTQHAAFLGGSGSGKTTVALNLIEQLVERGVPAVLVDRKGDLCGYADAAWWDTPADGDHNAARKRALKDRVAPRLYTPGNPRGRPLRLSIVPTGMSGDKEFDQLASSAGSALACMIGFAESRHGAKRAILIHSVKQLALLRPDRESSIEDLVELIDSQDPSLVNAIGRLDTRLFNAIVQALETLRLTRGHLFDSTAEQVDFDRLLLPADGRTPLTIVSTKFLGDTLDVQFWVAQFLNELRRWASGHPSSSLQAVFLFDEADVYLPARSQPASKAPMEDLLKRARSSGIGLLLATQSPGDLDYKCRENIRSWFLGRIKEDTAIAKLKPMLEAARGDVASKLPGQQPGEFQFVRDGQVISLKADRSLLQTHQLSDEAILRLSRA